MRSWAICLLRPLAEAVIDLFTTPGQAGPHFFGMCVMTIIQHLDLSLVQQGMSLEPG
jgi:hypothetical protein